MEVTKVARYITNENMARVVEGLRTAGVKEEVNIDTLRKVACKVIKTGDMSVVARFLQAGANMGYWTKKDYTTWTLVSMEDQAKLEEER